MKFTSFYLFVFIAIVSGLIALLADIFIKQTVIFHTIEKPHIPQECIKYRTTHHHYLSVFLLGCILFIVLHITGLNTLIK